MVGTYFSLGDRRRFKADYYVGTRRVLLAELKQTERNKQRV